MTSVALSKISVMCFKPADRLTVRVLALVTAFSMSSWISMGAVDSGPARLVRATVCDFSAVMTFPVSHGPIALHQEDSKVILFGRYWITPNIIRMEVLWNEPSWGPQPFPTYPPGFVVIATKDQFKQLRAYVGKPNIANSPFPTRPSANGLVTSYKVSDLQFAWSEYLEESSRIQAQWQWEPNQVELTQPPAGVTLVDGRIATLKPPLLSFKKEIEFIYGTNANGTFLSRQIVMLPEYAIPASGLITNIQGVQTGTNLNYGIRYHKDGRMSTVDWQPMLLDGSALDLPTCVTVNVLPPGKNTSDMQPQTTIQSLYAPDGKLLVERRLVTRGEYDAYWDLGGQPLRQTRLYDYQVTNLPPELLLSETNFLYCSMSLERQHWYADIQNRYWRTTMSNLDPNRRALDEVLAHITAEVKATSTPPEQLRVIYVRVISALIVNDDSAFRDLLGMYVTLLHDAGAGDITINCLLNLKCLCNNWGRPVFAELIQHQLDKLSESAN